MRWSGDFRASAGPYFLKTCGLTSSCLINAFHNCLHDSGEPWGLTLVRGRHIGKLETITSSLCMTTKLPSTSP